MSEKHVLLSLLLSFFVHSCMFPRRLEKPKTAPDNDPFDCWDERLHLSRGSQISGFGSASVVYSKPNCHPLVLVPYLCQLAYPSPPCLETSKEV